MSEPKPKRERKLKTIGKEAKPELFAFGGMLMKKFFSHAKNRFGTGEIKNLNRLPARNISREDLQKYRLSAIKLLLRFIEENEQNLRELNLSTKEVAEIFDVNQTLIWEIKSGYKDRDYERFLNCDPELKQFIDEQYLELKKLYPTFVSTSDGIVIGIKNKELPTLPPLSLEEMIELATNDEIKFQSIAKSAGHENPKTFLEVLKRAKLNSQK